MKSIGVNLQTMSFQLYAQKLINLNSKRLIYAIVADIVIKQAIGSMSLRYHLFAIIRIMHTHNSKSILNS